MKSILAAIAVLVGGAAMAAPVGYTLDPDHTIPRFEVSHNGYSFHMGAFMKSSGKAILDTEAKTGSVELTIQTASFLTGHPKVEEILKSADFLNIDKYPVMTYRSTRIRFEGDNPAVIEGDLTILGVAQPVTLTMTHFKCGPHPYNKRQQCGGNFVGKIKRSDFGMKAFLPALGDEIKLLVQVEGFKD